jgi:hypothetical protein
MARLGQYESAAKLLGAASVLKPGEEPNSREKARLVASLKADLDAIRGALGEEAFTAAWEAGRTLSLEAAMQEALGSAIPSLP